MAGILDKIKGMFAGAKDKATAEGGPLDTLEDKAGELKDKVEEAIPGDSDGDGK